MSAETLDAGLDAQVDNTEPYGQGAGDGVSDTLAIDLTKVKPVLTLPAGIYTFKVDGANRKKTRNDPNWHYSEIIMSALDAPEGTVPDDVYVLFMDPKPGDTPKQVNRRMSEINDFIRSTGGEPSPAGFRPKDFVGCTLRAEVVVGKNQSGKPRNDVSAFLPPV